MLGRSRAVSHERNPSPWISGAARVIALSRTERSHIRQLWREAGSLFLQSRRGEPACSMGGPRLLPPALLLCRYGYARARRHHPLFFPPLSRFRRTSRTLSSDRRNQSRAEEFARTLAH